jgi:16S rRNA (adenine1518-N6/adenine1519-N6)-dimethyltransferase
MPDAPRQTRSYLMQLFERQRLHPRTDLGQNFLIDVNTIELVVREAELTRDDVVLEVGAGTGGMTTFLAQAAGHVVSVEIDRNMHRFAAAATATCDNVTLLNVDALAGKNRLAPEVLDAVHQQLAASPERRLKLVANLPYSVATPVVSHLVATELPWTRMVITIQFELAQRMAAAPRESAYGALPVWLQSQCRVTLLRKVPPTSFWPRPQVDSAVVRLDPAPDLSAAIDDREFLHDFIRRLFQQRRKLLRGVLASMYRQDLAKAEIDQILSELGLGGSTRAEELDVATLVRLSNRFRKGVPQASSAQ